MKVLIIGGTGIIGGAITKAAAKKGMNVHTLSRRPLTDSLSDLGITCILGDWKNEVFAKQVVSQGFDVIVDALIFNKNDMKRDLGLVEDSCRQFIFISTDAVYIHPDENVREETADTDISKLKWSYGKHKREAEIYLETVGNELSCKWTVIRPTLTFGKTRIPVGFASRQNELTLVDRICRGKPIVVFDDPESKHSLCHSSTFGNAATSVFMNDDAYSSIFHISDDNSYTYREIFAAIGRALGVEPSLVQASPIALKRYWRSKYDEIIYDKNPEFTLDNNKIKSLANDTVFDVNVDDAIAETILYLQESNRNLPRDARYEMMSDFVLLSNKGAVRMASEEESSDEYVGGLSLASKTSIRVWGLKTAIKEELRSLISSCRRY